MPGVRLIVARCEVVYQGRLGARLAPAVRLVLLKADGSVAVHSDSRAYKPLNWMSPPCTIDESADGLRVTNPKGETLEIGLLEVLADVSHDLGDDPGLDKDGVEADLQELLAERLDVIETGLSLVRREYPTDIGPVDIMCRDGAGAAVAVEVKRIGEIAGVEQLARYLERLDLDPILRPVRGIFVATEVKPQARVLAEARGVGCVEVDLSELRDLDGRALRLF
ncbi:MAG: endonuclease NucS [Acidimicrobiia bacterium]|nr:endonuclease NucS [Acidimicrobiia bacterium]